MGGAHPAQHPHSPWEMGGFYCQEVKFPQCIARGQSLWSPERTTKPSCFPGGNPCMSPAPGANPKSSLWDGPSRHVGGFCTWGVSVPPSASHPTPHHCEPFTSGLSEQVPEPGHCRVDTGATCCLQRGRLPTLPLKQQLLRHCPGAPRCSRLCMFTPLHSASAWAAGGRPKPFFLKAP